MKIEKVKSAKCFGGEVAYFQHESQCTRSKMKFSTFIPGEQKVDKAIIWLSGLTCTEENFITKSGIQSLLQNKSIMVICPDTSPRGLNLPQEHDSYDFGSGASFYLNATTSGYQEHYQMYDYIASEVVELLRGEFGISAISLMGHSMGGHGALVLGLREKNLFASVSAFSPIVNPCECPWGQKAFTGYLGDPKAHEYDATELIKSGMKRHNPILIDQGLADEFLEKELLIENLIAASREQDQKIELRYRKGYDHSYFFIATFLGEHISFHEAHLNSELTQRKDDQ